MDPPRGHHASATYEPRKPNVDITYSRLRHNGVTMEAQKHHGLTMETPGKTPREQRTDTQRQHGGTMNAPKTHHGSTM